MKFNRIIIYGILILATSAITAQEVTESRIVQGDSLQNIEQQSEKRVFNPWQQKGSEILLSPYLSHYRATSFRNSSGEKSDFSNNGLYTNYNPRLFFSLSLKSDKINLFGSLPYFINRYEDDLVENLNNDFGDLELGLRFTIKNFEDQYLMGAVIGYLPLYSNNQAPFAGYDLFGLEPRLILAGTSKLLGEYNNFHKIELGLRYFFPNDPFQLRFLISEGYRITDRFTLLGELDGMFSFSGNTEFFENNLQLVGEYRMIKASFNIGYDFTDSFALYGGLFHDIYNRNSAIGSGFQVFAVIKLK